MPLNDVNCKLLSSFDIVCKNSGNNMYLLSFCIWVTRLKESAAVINSSIRLHQSRNDTCVEGRRFMTSKEPIHTSGCSKACRTDQIPQWTRSPLSQKVFGSLHIMNVRRTCLSSSVTNLSYAWFTWLESPYSLTSRILASQCCWHTSRESLVHDRHHPPILILFGVRHVSVYADDIGCHFKPILVGQEGILCHVYSRSFKTTILKEHLCVKTRWCTLPSHIMNDVGPLSPDAVPERPRVHDAWQCKYNFAHASDTHTHPQF